VENQLLLLSLGNAKNSLLLYPESGTDESERKEARRRRRNARKAYLALLTAISIHCGKNWRRKKERFCL
jgi:hypothetical protein